MELNALINIVGTDCDLAGLTEKDIDNYVEELESRGEFCTDREIEAAKNQLLELNGCI